MTQKPGPPDQPGIGNAMNQFFIDNVQYCPDCANKTMTLNVPQEWIITNDSTPQHPFHIHTNPHQLVEQGSIINGQYVPFLTYNPPVWGDTIALPAVTQASSQGQQGCWNIPAGPIANNDAAQQQCSAACAAQKNDVVWQLGDDRPRPDVGLPMLPTERQPRLRQNPSAAHRLHRRVCAPLPHSRPRRPRHDAERPGRLSPRPYYGKPRSGGAECGPDNFIPAAKPCPREYKTGPMCASGS
jgi:hypothetical protein